jgi:ABC-type phosphate transport system substrate-binding protein
MESIHPPVIILAFSAASKILFPLLLVFYVSSIALFIEWILSDQGQELISKTGYMPVK